MLGRAVVPVFVLLLAGLVLGGSNASASAYDAQELRLLNLLNEYRQDHGLETLMLSDTLSVAAEKHSRDMAEHDFFAHDTYGSSYYPVGSRPWDRMAAEGYDYNTYKGENLAVGYETASAALRAWKNSASHNAAMLDGNYRVVGIARVYDPDSAYGWYWTTDFGGHVDPSARHPEKEAEQRSSGPPEDVAGIENGGMHSAAVWGQEARDGADLVLEEGYARLGEYNNGVDDLSQTVRIEAGDRLSFRLRIKSEEQGEFNDHLLVRLGDGEGRQLTVLERYTGEDRGRWHREEVEIPPRFSGRTVYVSFFVRTDEKLLTLFHIDNVRLSGS